MSMSVFSIASYISMVLLLGQLLSNRAEYPDIPVLRITRSAWHEVVKIVLAISDYGNTAGYIFN